MQQFKTVTRKDVALKAGVSETIVSYVINNNRYVSKEKRMAVEQAIQELNYHPNNIARTLKGKKSNHIIFIADQIANEHFSQIVSEMENCAFANGYIISLCSNRNTESFVSAIISRQYDGIVISSISFQETYIMEFIKARIPVVVLVNQEYTQLEGMCGKIDTGLYTGARACVRHLLEKGRKQILYIDRYSKNGNFSTIKDLRYKGFVDELSAAGIYVTHENIITGCTTEQEVFQMVQKRFSHGVIPDAIFGRNDKLACIAMTAVKASGYQVPQDVSLIGFDNSSLSKYTTPQLTTMEIQREAIGKAAIEMLYQMINGSIPSDVCFETKLIEREST